MELTKVEEGIVCKICSGTYKKLNNAHLATHGLSIKEYNERFGVKRCSMCKKDKPLSGFSKNRSRSDGLRAYCKDCASVVDKKWRIENPEKSRRISKTSYDRHMTPEKRFNYKLKHVYNLKREDFDKMYDTQNGKCKLCYKEIKAQVQSHVDHNHDTGVIRGLLCSKCNLGLGHFYDNSDVLVRASKYILMEGDI